MADINDVYAWMTTDGAKVNLAMTVSPADDDTRHVRPDGPVRVPREQLRGHRNASRSSTQDKEYKVICTFASNTTAQCWVATRQDVDRLRQGRSSATAA